MAWIHYLKDQFLAKMVRNSSLDGLCEIESVLITLQRNV